MDQRIRFRYVMSQMSGKQLLELMTQLITETNNDQLIIELLWDRICNKDDNELAMKCIQIASTVMQEDDEKNKCPNNNIQLQQRPVEITSIPNTVLGEIGSYLNLNDHLQSEKVNRQFFIALRNIGPTIKCLPFGKVIKYAKYCINGNISFHANLFKNVKMLEFYNKMIEENQDIINLQQVVDICDFSSVKRLYLECVTLDDDFITICQHYQICNIWRYLNVNVIIFFKQNGTAIH